MTVEPITHYTCQSGCGYSDTMKSLRDIHETICPQKKPDKTGSVNPPEVMKSITKVLEEFGGHFMLVVAKTPKGNDWLAALSYGEEPEEFKVVGSGDYPADAINMMLDRLADKDDNCVSTSEREDV